MKTFAKTLSAALLSVLLFGTKLSAQQHTYHQMFSAGHAGAFVGGLYDAFYPYKQLEQHGDFGLGAPSQLDGELMVLDGKLYQTRYTGVTRQLTDTGHTPYTVVCFFKADKVFKPGHPLTRDGLFKYLDSVLNNVNGLYAIRITGTFKLVKTRAFPPVTRKPYQPISSFLDKQVFFTFNDVKGDLIGFKTPAFMAGPAISGYHFHFLSEDKLKGGHMVDVIAGKVTIRVEVLSSYTIALPQTAAFKAFNFKTEDAGDIKKVENEKK